MTNLDEFQVNAPFPSGHKRWSGFTLVELMVAMLVFLVIGGAAVSLIKRHVPLFASEQNQATLNVGVRNAVAQMQMDVVNAGSGFYPGVNMPFFPTGITVANTGTTSCHDAAWNYTGCFDRINVITADDTIPPAHPSGNAAGTAPADTTSGTLFLTFPGVTPAPTAANLTSWATTKFTSGTELLLIQGGTDFSSGGGGGCPCNPRMTTVILSSPVGTVSGSSIQVSYTPTLAGGVPATIPDLMGIITLGDTDQLTNSFDPTQDYAIKLFGISYGVDTSVPSNPKLVRVPFGTALTGSQNIVAEQIIGFKVAVWNTLTNSYLYDSTQLKGATGNCCDWTSIKAVRIDLTARTPVNSDPSVNFRNSLDGGPYQVQKTSVVINPRNLSM
jgi:prepilin-type N-terminal cleavage/methylation domain-containing protein